MDAPPPHEDPRPFVAVAEWLRVGRPQRAARSSPATSTRACCCSTISATRGCARRSTTTRRASASCTSWRPTCWSTSTAIRRCPACRLHGLDQWLEELMLFPDWYCPALGLDGRRRRLSRGLDRGAGAGRRRTASARSPCCAIITPRTSCWSAAATASRISACSISRTRLPAIRPTTSPRCSRTRGATSRRRSSAAMIDRYIAATGQGEAFERAYWALAAQRNTRILGVFTRLWKRDGKPHYTRVPAAHVGAARARPRSAAAGAGARLVRRQCRARASRRAVGAKRRDARARRALRLRAEVAAEVPATAMVMAAGLGKRMRPLTATKPKPLIEVAGKPLLDHVLDRLRAAGVKKVVVNVHYLADALEAHLASDRRRPRRDDLRRARAAARNRRRAGPGAAD